MGSALSVKHYFIGFSDGATLRHERQYATICLHSGVSARRLVGKRTICTAGLDLRTRPVPCPPFSKLFQRPNREW